MLFVFTDLMDHYLLCMLLVVTRVSVKLSKALWAAPKMANSALTEKNLSVTMKVLCTLNLLPLKAVELCLLVLLRKTSLVQFIWSSILSRRSVRFKLTLKLFKECLSPMITNMFSLLVMMDLYAASIITIRSLRKSVNVLWFLLTKCVLLKKSWSRPKLRLTLLRTSLDLKETSITLKLITKPL